MLSIYKASAGSGKTFRLAYEYIKMLLGVKNRDTGVYSLNRGMRDRHRNILAVTFTNKATDEMKRRIIHELAVLGGMEKSWKKKSQYQKKLCNELRCTPDELREASATALRQLLFDFNFFQVSTIDSFFQTILRTFAREVDIAGNYEVDLDNDRAVGQGVRDLFDSLAIDSGSVETKRLVRWITQYLLGELAAGNQVMIFNRQSNVHARFLSFIKNISNDDFSENYDRMMEYLSDPERLRKLSERLSELIDIQLADTRQQCSGAIDEINARGYGGNKGHRISSNLMKQLAGVAVTGEETGKRKTAEKVLEDPAAAYVGGLDAFLEGNPDVALEEAIGRACRSIVDGGANLSLLRSIRSNLFVLGLLERVYYHVNRYRNENNTIYLSDTNSLLRNIIGDEADNGAPFVYERVGVWINHYLIDEFQDTSRLQWENMRPLLGQGLSENHDSLIIGDEKQCIYRFRFSDPTLLRHDVAVQFGDTAVPLGDDEEGNKNWRSSADVVRFNNDLFRILSRNIGFDDIYENVEQKVSDKHVGHRGYVKMAGIDSTVDESIKSKALEIMTRDIVRQLKDGYRPCDIAVLTRFNTEAGAVISHIMDVAGSYPELRDVRIMSDDAMSVASAPAVKMIVSVMRFVASPDGNETDDGDGSRRRMHLREIARMINRYEHFLSLSDSPAASLEEALRSMNSENDGDALSVESEVVEAMACLNVPSLVERIIVRYVSPEVARDQNMYISAFVDIVTDFCSRGSADLNSFLQWWDDTGHRTKVSAPFDERAIRMMTIHKSKGLEFKCVHLPFANWKMIDFRDLEWFETGGVMPGIEPELVPPMIPLRPVPALARTQFAAHYNKRCREQLLDELNVLYVAMTRAIDELSVCYRAAPGRPESYLVSDMLASALGAMEMSVRDIDAGSGDAVEPDEVKVSVVCRGEPVGPGDDDVKPPTALDPEGTDIMNPYTTADRDDLWGELDVERYLDYGVARERGIVLHDVLARIRTSADVEKAVKYCCYHGRLPKEEAAEVLTFLSGQIARADVNQWFDGYKRAVRERPLVIDDGTVRRPDRVVWTADGHCDVIDYKFGQENKKKYGRQVREYMDALSRMGNENVRGFIWYVDSSVIDPVGDEL